MSEQTGHDISMFREMLRRDYGFEDAAELPEQVLVAYLDAAKAYVRASGRRWSYHVIAAERMRDAREGPPSDS